MSKGSQFVGLRLPPDLWREVQARIASRNDAESKGHCLNSCGQWDLSAYIRYAIEQDIKHAKRSRAHGKSKRPGTPAAGTDPAGREEAAGLAVQDVQVGVGGRVGVQPAEDLPVVQG